jgi:hypothetical protein
MGRDPGRRRHSNNNTLVNTASAPGEVRGRHRRPGSVAIVKRNISLGSPGVPRATAACFGMSFLPSP